MSSSSSSSSTPVAPGSSSSSSSSGSGIKYEPSCLCRDCHGELFSTECSETNSSIGSCNSVVFRTGQFRFSLPLLSISGIGSANWSFELNYLIDNGVDSLLGRNFNFTQFEHLVKHANGDIDLISSQNTIEQFELVAGVYSSKNNNTAAVLESSGTGANEVFTLTRSGGSVSVFFGFDLAVATPGQIKSQSDRFGNTLTFTWSAGGGGVSLLDKVADGYDREIIYRYANPGTGTRLSEIEDFLGRKLNFQYDTQGRLLAVITPTIFRAAEGNTFPGGTAYAFRYASAPGNPDNLVNVWYPNQVMPYLDTTTREVDINALYTAADAGNAAPRYTVAYDAQDRVTSETVGDSASGVGGSYTFNYAGPDLPKTNLIDASDPIVAETVVTDRNGNITAYFYNAADLVVCQEVRTNRDKISLSSGTTPSAYVTWTKYNDQNQVLERVLPAGNSVLYEYEDGVIAGVSTANDPYVRRRGLRLVEKRTPGNTHNINTPTRNGSGPVGEVQEELTKRFFYDPIFNNICAVIEERGNPIQSGSPNLYFTPQNGNDAPNGWDTPDDADRSRYATITYYDYQQNTDNTIKNNTTLQDMLFPGDAGAATKIQALIDYVDAQMKATDGTGGIPDGFETNLGDINGDGTGDGNTSGLSASVMLGNVVKIKHPDVRLLAENQGAGDPWEWQRQQRVELFTVNLRGQNTTHTDPEGNVTVYVRYPLNDPEGDGQFIAQNLSATQYGRMREVHVDADPDDVMSLVGLDGDLADFKTNVFPRDSRTNTPGVYQDLTTRYEGGMASGGCPSCAYDPLGNPLATTDPRGFTMIYERNELGEVFRSVSSRPYEYMVETFYDANRNVVREDTEDVGVQYDSDDPASAGYAHFTPQIDENSPNVAHVPTKAGPGGEIRPGWFTNLYMYDLLDNVIEKDLDATGSSPSSLLTQYAYDANENLVMVTKPEGNTVRFDYDERDLRIAEAVGSCIFTGTSSSSSSAGPNDPDCAITISFYDRNGNLEDTIGPAKRGSAGNHLTATIEDAFGDGAALVHTGDYLVENTYDGFDRIIESTDAVGNVTDSVYDPGSRVIETSVEGPVGGATPTNRNGTNNVKLSDIFTRFDEAGRTYEGQHDVFLATGTTLPSSRAVTHTGGGLESNATTNGHTATITMTASPQQVSYVLSRTVHDAADRVVARAQDNTGTSQFEYDGADRQVKATDAVGNIVENTYDGNSNIIVKKRIEKCTITQPTVNDEEFERAMYFDCLNRMVVSAVQGADGTLSNDPQDSETLFTYLGYDSRDNIVVTIDPRENTIVTVYDGASRQIETHEHLRKLGEGDNPPLANQTFLPASNGVIRTISILDGNGRTRQLIDDRGAPTNFTYDTLDRQLTMVFQDGSTRTNTYNAASDVITYTDENGSVFDCVFDSIGRPTSCTITPASGVAGHNGDSTRGTTAQTSQYDGLSRMTQSVDTTTVDNASSQSATVDMVFDSLSRGLEDSQNFQTNTRNTTSNAFTSFPVTQFTYPQGRQLDNTYDSLYRRTLVEEASGGADIAKWEFFGLSRVAECELGNGLICSHMNNARTHSAVQSSVSNPGWGGDSSDRLGYDGTARMITKRYLAGGINGGTGAYNDSTAVVGFTTQFDKASNKLYERDLHAESRSSLYQPRDKSTGAVTELGHDSVDRLRQYQRGELNGDGGGDIGGSEVATVISLPGTDESRTYDLDGLGNWNRTVFTPEGGSATTQIRDHNYLNEITRTKENATETDFTYDGAAGASNGNIANDGTRSYIYDAFNRVTQVSKDPNGTPAVVGAYSYDASGRRIRKVVSNGGLSGSVANGTTDFVYSGWQCFEERDGSNDAVRQYVWGIYIDELIQQRSISGMSTTDRYMLSDPLHRGTALTDSSGGIDEAYDTDAYGNTIIFAAAGTGGDWWANDASTTNDPTCQFIFTGRRFDPESEIYFYRARYYVPEWGRFISRDPLGYIDAMSLYEYVGSKVLRSVDPFGLICRSKHPDPLNAKGEDKIYKDIDDAGPIDDVLSMYVKYEVRLFGGVVMMASVTARSRYSGYDWIGSNEEANTGTLHKRTMSVCKEKVNEEGKRVCVWEGGSSPSQGPKEDSSGEGDSVAAAVSIQLSGQGTDTLNVVVEAVATHQSLITTKHEVNVGGELGKKDVGKVNLGYKYGIEMKKGGHQIKERNSFTFKCVCIDNRRGGYRY